MTQLVLTKTEDEIFLFPSGGDQVFPNETTNKNAVVVPANAENDYSHLKIVEGVAVQLTPEELSEIAQEKEAKLLKGNVDKLGEQLDNHLDATAREYGYDDVKTVVTYADEPAVPKFQTEGKAFRRWRSECYAYAYQQMATVTVDSTFEEFKVGLPVLTINY